MIGLVLVATGAMIYLGQQSRGMAQPTAGSGVLADCPPSPNCVSSAADGEQAYPAWLLTPGASWDAVVAVIDDMPAAEIVLDNGRDYLHAEFSSRVFGFVDDFELHLSGRQLAVRSASRVGESDLGVNRKRADAVAQALAAAGLLASG